MALTSSPPQTLRPLASDHSLLLVPLIARVEKESLYLKGLSATSRFLGAFRCEECNVFLGKAKRAEFFFKSLLNIYSTAGNS